VPEIQSRAHAEGDIRPKLGALAGEANSNGEADFRW